MRKTNETVYRCDHCNKAMVVGAGFMALHERMCKKNPKNKHKCFEYCSHCTKESSDTYDEDGRLQFVFICSAKNDLQMYSYKLERYKCNQDRIKHLTRMPLECDLYKAKQGHDFSEPIDYFTSDEWTFLK